MKNYLLLISCSQRKIQSPELLDAIERYDGPTYRTLRKLRREGNFPENVDVLIISAEYGIVAAHHSTNDYDRRMTSERADELRPLIQSRLRGAVKSKRGGYTQVFINLGKTYMQTLEGFHWGPVSTMEATGGIGQKTAQMKAWLTRIADNP